MSSLLHLLSCIYFVILSGVFLDEGEKNGVEGSGCRQRRSFDSVRPSFVRTNSAQDDVLYVQNGKTKRLN